MRQGAPRGAGSGPAVDAPLSRADGPRHARPRYATRSAIFASSFFVSRAKGLRPSQVGIERVAWASPTSKRRPAPSSALRWRGAAGPARRSRVRTPSRALPRGDAGRCRILRSHRGRRGPGGRPSIGPGLPVTPPLAGPPLPRKTVSGGGPRGAGSRRATSCGRRGLGRSRGCPGAPPRGPVARNGVPTAPGSRSGALRGRGSSWCSAPECRPCGRR